MEKRGQTLAALVFGLLFILPATLLATPAQILIIRHAEKPADGIHLSPEGEQRAAALVEYFEKNPDVTKYGTPAAIYAIQPKDDDSSVRSIETVTPLAKALGIAIKTPFNKDEVKDLAKEILADKNYDGKMVLICWDHKMIPELAKKLGVNTAPEKWPGSVFNQVWEIDYANDQVKAFKTFTQNL